MTVTLGSAAESAVFLPSSTGTGGTPLNVHFASPLSDEAIEAIAERAAEIVFVEQLDALVERVSLLVLARLSAPVVQFTPARPEGDQPDLAEEIAAYLGEHEGATTTEVITGVRRQAKKVRSELDANPRFERAPRRAGTNGRAKCWRLAPGRTETD